MLNHAKLALLVENLGLVSKCQQPTPFGNMWQHVFFMPSVVTKRRAERTASQKSSRCLPVATEHAASESPATIGKANWAGKGLAGVSPVSPKEKNILADSGDGVAI